MKGGLMQRYIQLYLWTLGSVYLPLSYTVLDVVHCCTSTLYLLTVLS